MDRDFILLELLRSALLIYLTWEPNICEIISVSFLLPPEFIIANASSSQHLWRGWWGGGGGIPPAPPSF